MLLAGAGALVVRAPGVSAAEPIIDKERILGDAEAPVSIIEYASLTCPHCAQFHVGTLPQLKEAYIDTGKVNLIYRDFPFDQWGLRAAMLARCSGEKRYFPMLATLFEKQKTWAYSDSPGEELARIGKLAGITQAEFDDCMANEQLVEAVLANRLGGEKEHGVDSTPTLIIDGKKHAGAKSFSEMEAILEPLLAE
jgi:protein-disulfide isomerase